MNGENGEGEQRELTDKEQQILDNARQELESHNDLRENLVNQYEEALRLEQELVDKIEQDRIQREADEYAAEKQKRDEKFYDLEGVK